MVAAGATVAAAWLPRAGAAACCVGGWDICVCQGGNGMMHPIQSKANDTTNDGSIYLLARPNDTVVGPAVAAPLVVGRRRRRGSRMVVDAGWMGWDATYYCCSLLLSDADATVGAWPADRSSPMGAAGAGG